MTQGPVLFCTVGGSHQPIVTAIKALSPAHVCFFCTGRDPATGKPGSDRQILGKGNIIKAHPDDAKPTLPNIPAQANLGASAFEVREVPADDPDQAYQAIRGTIDATVERFPAARFVADYTGGTKTMSVALVLAAIDHGHQVELQLVAGARADLVRVRDGTEQAMSASVAELRLERDIESGTAAWERFAYEEAAGKLDSIRISASSPQRPRLDLLRALSHGLARWDAFDHQGAHDSIDPYASRVGEIHPSMLGTLRLLVKTGDKRHDPALLWDLWLNAERRAAQGRFDDAIGRWYRLVEWTAQWRLRSRHRLDTANFPCERLPAGEDVSPGRDGKIKIGLRLAWDVLASLDESAHRFWDNHGSELLELLGMRNHSILAHGFEPVGEEHWKRVASWTGEHFLPILTTWVSDAGIRKEFSQLPARPPVR